MTDSARGLRRAPPPSSRLVLGAALLAAVCLARRGGAQPPPCPPVAGIASPCLPPVPEKGPRPATGRESVSSFVDSLNSRDAAIEVVVGQGRVLSLKEDITAGGKGEAAVGVGDPTVIDFEILTPRQVRLLGQRIGITDFAITTSAGRTYTFEVRVVLD